MSAWLEHVKKTMKLNPGKQLKDVLKLAAKTYKKTKSTVKYAVTGKRKRTRRGKKSRRNRRHKSEKGKKHKSKRRRNKSSRRRRR